MKTLLLALCLMIVHPIATAAETQGILRKAEILRVVDGDTVVFKASFLPDPLKKELSLRVFGVDSPGIGGHADCDNERIRGLLAKEFTTRLVTTAKKRQIVLYDWDKYGGRVLGDVVLDGKSLRQLLIENGHAREYHGGTKLGWCK